MRMSSLYQLYRKEYYVYEHYIDGNLFYIGKGKGGRAVEFWARNDDWKRVVDGRYGDVEVKIIKGFEDESEALSFESKLLQLNIDNEHLTNQQFTNYHYNSSQYKKQTKEFILNRIVEVIPEYLDRVLINADKIQLCEKLNLFDIKGRMLMWKTIKKYLIENGFVINDKTKTINGKRCRVVIIHDSQNLIDKSNIKSIMNDKILNRIVEVIPEYLDRVLINADKTQLCEELNLLDNKGRMIMWSTIKKYLIENGFVINEKTKTINGKRCRIVIIHDSHNLINKSNINKKMKKSISKLEKLLDEIEKLLDEERTLKSKISYNEKRFEFLLDGISDLIEDTPNLRIRKEKIYEELENLLDEEKTLKSQISDNEKYWSFLPDGINDLIEDTSNLRMRKEKIYEELEKVKSDNNYKDIFYLKTQENATDKS